MTAKFVFNATHYGIPGMSDKDLHDNPKPIKLSSLPIVVEVTRWNGEDTENPKPLCVEQVEQLKNTDPGSLYTAVEINY